MGKNKTEIWLTRHMFGEKLKKIAECDSFNEAMACIEGWKTSNLCNDEYKIESYNRLIYDKEKGAAVDFGDYSYFMLITSGEA